MNPNIIYAHSRSVPALHVESTGITPTEWKTIRVAARGASSEAPWLAAMPAPLAGWMNALAPGIRSQYFKLDMMTLPAGI